MSYVGIGGYSGDGSTLAAIGADSYLCHLPVSNGMADTIRAANPNAAIWGRFDAGRDDEQVDTSRPAKDEAWRWYLYIQSRVRQSPAGTFAGVVGICEWWPNTLAALQWRADFEYWLAVSLEGAGIHYAWGSVPVGNLEPEQIAMFAPVIQTAWAVNYHGYLSEGRTRLDQEQDAWHLWRPLDLWLPECRRLGLPFERILLGEVGTFNPWDGEGMTREEYARLCINVARAFGQRCEGERVHCLGGMGFGLGTMGAMARWNMGGTEGILAEAIRQDREGEAMPVVGEGFRKTEPFVGPWKEDETYHAPGTPHQTSLAIGERGFAVYRSATNETIAVTDAGEILADAGNHADGVLRRVRPPF